MYTYNIDDVPAKFAKYRLCYVEDICPYILDAESRVGTVMNPEYKIEKSEKYAYFINSAPWRYDDIKSVALKDCHSKRVNVIRVPFWIDSCRAMTPSDWCCGELKMDARDINGGAMAWIYDPANDNGGPISIYGGETLASFIKKLSEIGRKSNY